MAVAVIMPRQGQSVESCILGQWYKNVGDEVKTGDLLFSYETDKAAFDEEAKADGILLARFFDEGDEVSVLATVAVIGNKGESIEEFTGDMSASEEPISDADKENELDEIAKVIEFSVEPDSSNGRVRISPLARNMAEKMGIDYVKIEGTGPMGRIIARDIEAAKTQKPEPQAAVVKQPETAQQKPVAKTPVHEPITISGDFEVKPLSNMRKLIAKSMHQSLQNSAQLTHHLSADARNLQKARAKFKKQFESGEIQENVTLNDLICFAVINALKKFRQANAHFLGDSIKYFKKVNLGLAVDTDRGLMVPALLNADDYSITGLSSRLRQLASDARKGSVNPDLLSPEAATFTVSNLGNYGVEMFTPVINLPQVAILGVCTIVLRPKDIGNGVIAFVPMIGLSLTYDHRALDGGEATLFLAEIKKEIEALEF